MCKQRNGVRFEKRPIFTEVDYEIVRKAVAVLSPKEQKIIHLHFWEGLSATEICREMDMPWHVVERCLARSFEKIRKFCLFDPVFSRSELGNVVRAA